MSCLFDSLEIMLKDDLYFYNISSLREAICNYMKVNNNNEINGEKIENWLKMYDKDTHKYIEKMKNINEWGGGAEIAIASKMFNIIINIRMNGEIIATFNCSDNPRKEIIINYTGNHYMPTHDIKLLSNSFAFIEPI